MADDLRRELGRWGFSEAEIDVYFAVLETGEGPASTIAEHAGVSTRHVYRVCEGLEERGLVDVDEHVQPTRIRPRPPSVVQDLVNESCATINDGIESMYDGSSEEPAEIDVLKRRSTVLGRTRRLLEDAREWAILVAPPDVVEAVQDGLAEATDRGVLVFVVTDANALSTHRPLDDVATMVRSTETPIDFQKVGTGVDRYRSLMVSHSSGMGGDDRYSPALYLDDETIAVRVNHSLFGMEWRLAADHMVPRPTELPFTSELFRETVLQAALHLRSGTALRATVRGRSLDDARSATVEGTVSEVRQEFVEPYRQSFLGERTMILDTTDGPVTVGGPYASLEDYAAESITLSAADDAPE